MGLKKSTVQNIGLQLLAVGVALLLVFPPMWPLPAIGGLLVIISYFLPGEPKTREAPKDVMEQALLLDFPVWVRALAFVLFSFVVFFLGLTFMDTAYAVWVGLSSLLFIILVGLPVQLIRHSRKDYRSQSGSTESIPSENDKSV